MNATGFWEKKRQELQSQGKLPTPRHEPVPNTVWWSDDNSSERQARRGQLTELPDSYQEHDYSRATHLHSKEGNCPNCNSANYMKPSSSGAARCWNCGYINGRQVNDLDTMSVIADVHTVKVRQTEDGGASKYRARIGKTAAEIAAVNRELELSNMGKSYVDS